MGSIYDEFVMMEDPSNSSYAPSPVLQIESRMFQVRDVFVEELFSPAPWPLDMLPSQRYALRRTVLLPGDVSTDECTSVCLAMLG